MTFLPYLVYFGGKVEFLQKRVLLIKPEPENSFAILNKNYKPLSKQKDMINKKQGVLFDPHIKNTNLVLSSAWIEFLKLMNKINC